MAQKHEQHPQARFRLSAHSSNSEHTRKRRARWAEITCVTHGKSMPGATWKLPQVRVAIAENKRESIGICKAKDNTDFIGPYIRTDMRENSENCMDIRGIKVFFGHDLTIEWFLVTEMVVGVEGNKIN